MPPTPIKILFEDQQLLIINKPAGLVVNRSESVKGKTVQEWLEMKLRLKDYRLGVTDFQKRGGIVHRLDKETSGVMVLAKNEDVFINLQAQFKQRKVKKKYLALVHGVVVPTHSRINLPIKRSLYHRHRFQISIKGRSALTLYERKAVYYKGEERFSYLLVEPKTGRTHQIRVHLKHLHFPLVADPLYLGGKVFKKDKSWCPRLFLHSFYLEFLHPGTERRVSFATDLPEDLKQALGKLREEG